MSNALLSIEDSAKFRASAQEHLAGYKRKADFLKQLKKI